MKDSDKASRRQTGKLAPNGPPFIPPEIIPDTLKVPDNTILLVPDTQDFVDPPHFAKAGQHRDWFDAYFYHCLPLVLGNQHGFLMLSTYDFVCRWNGTNAVDGVSIHVLEPVLEPNYLTLESHFGFGILTIQSRYVFRTPENVNLMVKEPPNYPIHGFSWMNAVVETDNLRRDFTFNIKITQPHLDIYIPRNTPIGCLLPYPRYFLDGYNMAELKDLDQLRQSERTVTYFAKERDDFDVSPRHRYMEGVDIYNIEFKHHQKSLDFGKWWFSKRKKNLPAQFTGKAPEPLKGLFVPVLNTFKRFLLLTADLTDKGNSSEKLNGEGKTNIAQESKCPVKHNAGSLDPVIHSVREKSKSGVLIRPEDYPEIMALNAELPESTITLYLPPFYDKSLAPVKAERLRPWFEQDSKTKDHARFCLPLTMGAGIGWFILSPATFTVSWDGDLTHDAIVEILEGSSHAEIDNHSAHGSFTVQSQFIPRTKNPGDFVVIKGIANHDRLPYYFLEAMLESWWSPANFGLVAMLNQPGKFTIKKGEPIAQMFVINATQATYDLAFKDGYPTQWQAWDDKRRDPSYKGKNLDYLKGLWPDQSPVCPHFKSWSKPSSAGETSHQEHPVSVSAGARKTEAKEASLNPSDLIPSARLALSHGQFIEAENLLNQAITNSEKQKQISLDLFSTIHALGNSYIQKSGFAKAAAILSQALALSQRVNQLDDGRLASIITDLAYAQRLHGLLAEAEQNYRAALEIVMASSRDEIAIASSMFYLGSTLDQMGRYVEAEPLILEALDIRQRQLGNKHVDTLFTVNGLACLYTHQKRFDEATKLFASVIADREAVLGKESLDLADSYNDLGFLHRHMGNFAKAVEAFQQALVIKKQRLGEKHFGIAEFLTNLAFAYQEGGQKEKAESCFAEAAKIRENHLPKV